MPIALKQGEPMKTLNSILLVSAVLGVSACAHVKKDNRQVASLGNETGDRENKAPVLSCKVFLQDFDKVKGGYSEKDANLLKEHLGKKGFSITDKKNEAEYILQNGNPSEEMSASKMSINRIFKGTHFKLINTNVEAKPYMRFDSQDEYLITPSHKALYVNILEKMSNCQDSRNAFYRSRYTEMVSLHSIEPMLNREFEFAQRVAHPQSFFQPAASRKLKDKHGELVTCNLFATNFSGAKNTSEIGDKVTLKYGRAIGVSLTFQGEDKTEVSIACDAFGEQPELMSSALKAFSDVIQFTPTPKTFSAKKHMKYFIAKASEDLPEGEVVDIYRKNIPGKPVECYAHLIAQATHRVKVGDQLSYLTDTKADKTLKSSKFNSFRLTSSDLGDIEYAISTSVFLGNGLSIVKLQCKPQLDDRSYKAYVDAQKYFMSPEEVLNVFKNDFFE